MSGYKQVITDKMPQMLDLALIYCKAKSRWIDYVYEHIVKKYPKDSRTNAVKIALGIKQRWKRQEIYDHLRYVQFNKNVTKKQVDNIPKSKLFMSFEDTIDFDDLYKTDVEMYYYWKAVATWVDWFSKSYIAIRDSYQHMTSWNMSEHEKKIILMDKYGIDNRLATYLIKTF